MSCYIMTLYFQSVICLLLNETFVLKNKIIAILYKLYLYKLYLTITEMAQTEAQPTMPQSNPMMGWLFIFIYILSASTDTTIRVLGKLG